MTYLQGMWREQLQTAVATFNFIVILTVYLFLGLCGSALADKEVILEKFKEYVGGMPKYITHRITIANMLFVTINQYLLTFVVFRLGIHEGIVRFSWFVRHFPQPDNRLWMCSSASGGKWTATRWHLNTNQYNLFLYRFAEIGKSLLQLFFYICGAGDSNDEENLKEFIDCVKSKGYLFSKFSIY